MKNSNKGFVLITTLLLSSIILILTVAYVSRVATEYRLMSKIYNSTAVLDLAEAGIDRGLWEINYNDGKFIGWNAAVDPGTGDTIYTTSINPFTTSNGQVIGTVTITADIPQTGNTSTVWSWGFVPNQAKPDEKRMVRVIFTKYSAGYSRAVASLSSITMSGQAGTDSYDSSLGAYASQPHTQHGSVSTNGTINMSGQAYINGDANPGAGHPFSGHPPVSGSYGTLQAPLVVDSIPAATMSGVQSSNSNSNITITHNGKTTPYIGGTALSVSGQDTVTLSGGSYYFTSMTTSGQAAINITGSAIIYVDGGSVSISGQGIVNNGRPRDLQIYSTGSSISLSGQAAYAGAIYAPNSSVTLSGQENLYGSIICGSNIDSGQAKIHYDMDLLNVSPAFASNRVSSWQEIKQ